MEPIRLLGDVNKVEFDGVGHGTLSVSDCRRRYDGRCRGSWHSRTRQRWFNRARQWRERWTLWLGRPVKSLWKGKDLESISRKTGDVTNVTLHLRTIAAQLDVEKRSITDGDGNLYAYEKLLLATGGSARVCPFGGESIIFIFERSTIIGASSVDRNR